MERPGDELLVEVLTTLLKAYGHHTVVHAFQDVLQSRLNDPIGLSTYEIRYLQARVHGLTSKDDER
jgi:hypothetical protein